MALLANDLLKIAWVRVLFQLFTKYLLNWIFLSKRRYIVCLCISLSTDGSSMRNLKCFQGRFLRKHSRLIILWMTKNSLPFCLNINHPWIFGPQSHHLSANESAKQSWHFSTEKFSLILLLQIFFSNRYQILTLSWWQMSQNCQDHHIEHMRKKKKIHWVKRHKVEWNFFGLTRFSLKCCFLLKCLQLKLMKLNLATFCF